MNEVSHSLRDIREKAVLYFVFDCQEREKN